MNNGCEKRKHILVCLSDSPSNERVISAASNAAVAYKCSFTALLVVPSLAKKESDQLLKNMNYAAEQGAKIEKIAGSNVIQTIVGFVRQYDITDVFLGKSGPSRNIFGSDQAFMKLMKNLPGVDFHVIPAEEIELTPSRLNHPALHLSLQDTGKMLGIMAAATVISMLFYHSSFSNVNIITIYLLAVLITSVVTAEEFYGIVSALLFVFLFNFLFIEPLYSLRVYDPNYVVTYIVSVVAALITSRVSARLNSTSKAALESAYQSRILLNASEQLQHALNKNEIISITARQLTQLLNRSVLFIPIEDGRLQEAEYYPVPDDHEEPVDEPEAVQWVFANNHYAGAFTGMYPDSRFQYLSARVSDKKYGIVGIKMNDRDFTEFERNILLSLIGECALSLENDDNRRQREKMEIIAENERFRSGLLRSVSHDLRTPLTSISGNAAMLLKDGGQLTSGNKNQIYSDIYDDSMWLIELVENMLSITRLEDSMHLNLSAEIVQDVVDDALEHVDRHIREHHLSVERDDSLMIAEMDVHLIYQVIVNLVNNAVKYTPVGSHIVVSVKRKDQLVWISVSDDGPGISKEDQEHLFEKFYTGKHSISESRHSLGLGLSLCQSIMKAHGQKLVFTPVLPHGACFSFSLQIKEIPDEFIQNTGC